MDVIVSDYALRCTLNGYALCFPTDMESAAETPAATSTSYLNLWDAVHTKDTRPLVSGCTCYGCSRHNRAYLHHLLECHEMLAEVLLNLHNFHHMTVFMRSARAAIVRGDGAFERFRKAFGM